MIPKPKRIFARDFEWQALSDFVERRTSRPQLGCFSGAGFEAGVAQESDVLAIGLDQLYG
ncbi:hypothetical protein ACFYUV_22755 [Nonomuraea sp. NPDC003560]|uniref:hypothetical protein n=1 Tax=Nonomuraea sp. NPDC003560 TaxID=3364341 RepID=UPI0036A01EC2